MLNDLWHSDLIRYRCVRGWCADYFMKSNIGKTRIMTFATKSNALKTPWFLLWMRWRHQPAECCNRFKTTFYQRLDSISSQSRTFLGHIENIANYFLLLYLTLIKPKFQYTSFLWRSITSSDVKNFERVQWIFVSSCYSSISPMNIWVMTTHFTV